MMIDAAAPAHDQRSAGRATIIFLVLLCLFSAAGDALVIHLGKETAMLSRFLMWCPGAAALATCALHRVPQRTLGWRWPASRWLVVAYLLPLFYAVPVYGAAWLSIPGALDAAGFSATTAASYGLPGHPVLATTLIGVPLIATLIVLSTVTWALGEELGWRGFLLPRLVERIGFTGACLVSGLIWAVWHYPSLLWADYNAGTDPAYAVACFTAMVVAMGFVLGWLRLHSGSIWPCALLHASHNTFVQGILDPLTADVGRSRLVTTEFGFGMALSIAVSAMILLRRFPVVPDAASREPDENPMFARGVS